MSGGSAPPPPPLSTTYIRRLRADRADLTVLDAPPTAADSPAYIRARTSLDLACTTSAHPATRCRASKASSDPALCTSSITTQRPAPRSAISDLESGARRHLSLPRTWRSSFTVAALIPHPPRRAGGPQDWGLGLGLRRQRVRTAGGAPCGQPAPRRSSSGITYWWYQEVRLLIQ